MLGALKYDGVSLTFPNRIQLMLNKGHGHVTLFHVLNIFLGLYDSLPFVYSEFESLEDNAA